MALVAAIIGLPMFFEIGVVLLIPIVLLVAKRAELPLMRIGIPALAGLSVLHGLVPPHPGPLVAIDALKADLGRHPGARPARRHPDRDHRRAAVRLAVAARWVRPSPPTEAAGGLAGADGSSPLEGEGLGDVGDAPRPPRSAVTVATVLLPVVLMLLRRGRRADPRQGQRRRARRWTSSARRWSRCWSP